MRVATPCRDDVGAIGGEPVVEHVIEGRLADPALDRIEALRAGCEQLVEIKRRPATSPTLCLICPSSGGARRNQIQWTSETTFEPR